MWNADEGRKMAGPDLGWPAERERDDPLPLPHGVYAVERDPLPFPPDAAEAGDICLSRETKETKDSICDAARTWNRTEPPREKEGERE